MENPNVLVDYNPLIQLVLFLLGTIGMTHLLVDSNIFKPIRAYLKTILPEKVYAGVECYQCSGTWCGFLVGLITISHNPFVVMVCGCAGSFLASWAALYLNYLEAGTVISSGVDDK